MQWPPTGGLDRENSYFMLWMDPDFEDDPGHGMCTEVFTIFFSKLISSTIITSVLLLCFSLA